MSQPKSSQSNQLNPAASEVLQEAQGVRISAGFARLRDSIHREGMNLSCRPSEFPPLLVRGNSDGRQEGERGWFQAVQPFPEFFILTV